MRALKAHNDGRALRICDVTLKTREANVCTLCCQKNCNTFDIGNLAIVVGFVVMQDVMRAQFAMTKEILVVCGNGWILTHFF